MLKIVSLEQANESILRRQGCGLGRDNDTVQKAERAVSEIVADVQQHGDRAVRSWTEKFDRVKLDAFAVPRAECDRALAAVPAALKQSMELAAARVREFHQHQAERFRSWRTETMGGTVGQQLTPIDRVGVYVPGGSAPLISSALMSAIPAKVAGVQEVVLVTPPTPNDAMLAAAAVSGADEVLQLGGVQAIAALAYGTESVRPVDKIVGAGNLYVTLAKRQVFGVVGIDGLAGPTETVVIADETADPEWVAADLLAQAEHDPLASAILLTPSTSMAEGVQAAVERQLAQLTRGDIIRQALDSNSGIVMVADLNEAIAVSDSYAPEHLCLAVTNAQQWAEKVRHAGGIFVGERSCEVLGDYVAGPSHVMPTGGTARFASPLNVLDFVKISSWIALDAKTTDAVAPAAAALADLETLTAHAAAARCRCR